MRVYYREDNRGGVSNQFIDLNQPDIRDSLKYHAYYLQGETNMRQEEYARAVEVLSKVPPEHPQYAFAQHSLGVCHFMLDNTAEAANAYEACIQSRQETGAQKEAAYRSMVMLGYLFYEEGSMSKAVTALRMVPKTSFYYEDALLGLGWTGALARQWGDCISAGQELELASRDVVLQCEGGLMQSLAYLVQKDWANALRKVEETNRKAQLLGRPDADSLEHQKDLYKIARAQYDFLGSDVMRSVLSMESTERLVQVDSLHAAQIGSKKKIDDYIGWFDGFTRRSFFARGAETVRSDVDYMYARVKMMTKLKLKGMVREQQKTQEKQQQIDDEIDKLKRQMEKLE